MSERDRPIRVLHLLHTMAHGGVETALLNWIRSFDSARIQVRLCVFANPDGSERAFLESAARDGLTVDQIGWNRGKPLFRAARELAALVRRERMDVIHCHNTYANLVGLLAARMTGVKVATTYYVWGDFSLKRNALQWIDQLLMKRFDAVSAHCQQCFTDTVRRGADPTRLHLLICGYPAREIAIDESQRQKERAGLGAQPGETVFVYMARFWPEKAHDNLLQAFRALLDKHPQSRLWLPGVGPDKDAAEALARKLNVSENVDFLGFYPDPDRLLTLADIQVHPSDNEGVALAICAGMAAAKPIIASRVGGLEEVLTDNRSAVLLPPRSPQMLCDAMLALIRNPERALALGLEARRFITEEYSVELAAKRVEAMYAGMVRAHQ